jgi:hypothetical protein
MISSYARIGMALAATLSGVALSACSISGLSASSTCRDFMNASTSDQQAIVDKLATQYNKPAYTTPLGAPEVPYYCSANPTVTLQWFFQHAEG